MLRVCYLHDMGMMVKTSGLERLRERRINELEKLRKKFCSTYNITEKEQGELSKLGRLVQSDKGGFSAMIKIGDIVELVVRERESPSGNRKAVMYAGFKAVVREIKGDQAFVTTDGAGIMQAVSFKTWWPIADLVSIKAETDPLNEIRLVQEGRTVGRIKNLAWE